jgi:hypothetical protein
MLKYIENVISNLETDLKRVKGILFQLQNIDEQGNMIETDRPEDLLKTDGLKQYEEENVKVIEGVFDGYFML